MQDLPTTMKRDLDLIRRLLLSVEEDEDIDLSDYPLDEVVYHRALVIEAGLCLGMVSQGAGGVPNGAVIHRLTWEGHEYLDAVRKEDIWERTKTLFKNQGVAMTFDLAKTVALKLATDMLFR